MADAEQLIRDVQYTGPVTVNYSEGVAKEIQFPASPVRIVLDKPLRESDSKR